MPAMFFNAGSLYVVARTACERTRGGDTDPGQNDALVAILFSAATLEAFIADIARNIETSSAICGVSDPRLITFADVVTRAEDSQASTASKYQLGYLALTGSAYDKGQPPFQDFLLLFRIRNYITHLKPDELPDNDFREATPKFLQQLQAKGLCVKYAPETMASWLSHIETPAVAKWACNVAADMVGSIREALLPEISGQGAGPTAFRKMLESMCGDFDRIE